MKEKIIKTLIGFRETVLFDYNNKQGNAHKLVIGAAEEIIKEMDKACCEKCKYHTYTCYHEPPDRCEYHHIDISDTEILKCNDFTEMEGK